MFSLLPSNTEPSRTEKYDLLHFLLMQRNTTAWRDDPVDFHTTISKHDDNLHNFFHFSKRPLHNKNSTYSPNY